jgi:hypothetical protein
MTAQDNDANGINFNINAKSGSFTPSLQYYIVKIHGNSGTGVTVNGSSVTRYNNLSDLENAAGEGWATGADIYGNAVYVKVAAGNAKNIVVTR